MMNAKQKSFFDLYKSGVRFINKEDEDSLSHGLYKTNDEGKVEGYTINGMKNLCKAEKITLDGKRLSPEEIEMLFNILTFEKICK